ncbi:hypothetical protein U9M48_028892 [Paspalum notatum var. saurae]|uniref:Disease resistance protein RPM1 n=1 Tax=Paspalum notatum var. saurae TaxID=547442 RepID=A0AAQ3TXB2_PASNO
MEADETMKHIVTKLVKRCGCLPLAILTIGGILSTKKIAEWGKFFEELPSELESNPSLEAMRRIVTLSYNHLPSHLKPCFLYLSIFPEDFEIQRRRLIGRWIAEGFVKARDGVNIEDVGNSHFNELINRSMIQPSVVNIEGVVKKCTVHDIMRDTIVSICREENFVLLMKEDVASVEEENIRHVAFHGNSCSEICLDWSSVRSISVFGDRPMEPAPSFCSPQLRMLRVLDLEDAKFRITEQDVKNIGLLKHIKYLNIAGASYSFALLRSIGKLRCLQTLDMREANISALTIEITELRSLRSLRCSKRLGYGYFNLVDNPKGCLTIAMCFPMVFIPLVNFSDRANLIAEIRMSCSTRWSDTKGVKMPRGINHLKKLQILEIVDIKGTSRKVIEELEELSQLRKLSVTSKGATEYKYKIFCAAIEKLSSLQSLYVDAEGSSDVESLEWLASISSPPPFLRSLKLNGSLADIPDWFGNLKQLVKMQLSRSKLKEDKTMEVLGALPNLMILRLYRNAYVGEKLVFRRGAFPNLKEVDIYFLKLLREIVFEEGTFPHMGSIEIYGCRLESGIFGVKHLPRLKNITLQYDGEVAKFDMLRGEVDAHPNHPVLQISEDQRWYDLGGIGGSHAEAEVAESLPEDEVTMAETVLSMAGSLVRSAVRVATSAAGQEMSRLIGVQNEIWFIKDELETMQAFLRAAEVAKEKDDLVKVRDLAYDIQDCLEEFAVHVGSQSLLRQLMKLRHRHRIAVQIRSLKLRVEEVSNRNTRYNLIKSVPSSSMDDSTSNVEVVRYQAAHYIDEAELVGFDAPKKEILGLISMGGSAQLQVIWIVGTGGLGKTTLAKKVYESLEISTEFSCRAWITVSQSFSVKELLKEMIKQLLGNESINQLLKERNGLVLNEGHLADHLKKGLNERRYFLVLDDLWTTQAWDCIKPSFWGENQKGSRVLVTTRNHNIVEGPLVYELKALRKEDATDLLLRKVGRSHEDIEKDQMTETFNKIIKKCGGLPLAIVTIGGLLATQDVKEWDGLYHQLPSELETNSSLEAMRKVLMMSYNHLPSHLKPCFLYLSIFPEDFEIRRRRLVDRWIAEGFVAARVGRTIENVAESYFNELIQRSMIQPSRVNIEGHVKRCRVHDIVRDIIVAVSREENFVYPSMDNEPRRVEDNFRHVACHGSNYPVAGMDWSHVRSLTLFCDERPMELGTSLCPPQLRLLSVLDLQDIKFELTQKDIANIGLLRHLRYVKFHFWRNNMYAIPRSIGKLQGLQALEIGYSHISTLPTEICKLRCLRSLRCIKESYYKYFDLNNPMNCLTHSLRMPVIFTPLVGRVERNEVIAELHMACTSRWSKTNGVRIPIGINKLKDLQILEEVDIKRTSSKAIEELGELSQLQKLKKLSSLRALRVVATDDSGIGTLEWLGSDFSPPPLLRTLELGGNMGEMPDWFRNLTKLVKVTLYVSQLNEVKTMEILGALPNLMLLRLWSASYVGKELVFREGAFPFLRKLVVWELDQLTELRFEEGASPQIESIGIGGCRLESGIIGVNHLPRLKEISLKYGCQVARLDTLEEEMNSHPNQPVLRLDRDRSDIDLGEVQGAGVEAEATGSVPDHAGDDPQVIALTTSEPVNPSSEGGTKFLVTLHHVIMTSPTGNPHRWINDARWEGSREKTNLVARLRIIWFLAVPCSLIGLGSSNPPMSSRSAEAG